MNNLHPFFTIENILIIILLLTLWTSLWFYNKICKKVRENQINRNKRIPSPIETEIENLKDEPSKETEIEKLKKELSKEKSKVLLISKQIKNFIEMDKEEREKYIEIYNKLKGINFGIEPSEEEIEYKKSVDKLIFLIEETNKKIEMDLESIKSK